MAEGLTVRAGHTANGMHTPRSTEYLAWYTRREGKVRGPYSTDRVTRYILLGRIRVSDELSRNGSDWHRVTECPECLPDELRGNSGWDDYQRLVMARISLDERKSQRREGDGNPALAPGMAERRHGTDRRQLDRNVESFSCHLLGHEDGHGKRQQSSALRSYLLATLLVTLIVAWFSAVFR